MVAHAQVGQETAPAHLLQPQAEDVLYETEAHVRQLSVELACKIGEAYVKLDNVVIVPVLPTGLLIAGLVVAELGIDEDRIHPFHAEHWDNKDPERLKHNVFPPYAAIQGRDVVSVDDVYRTGSKLKYIDFHLVESMNARSHRGAVLYSAAKVSKQIPRAPQPSFVASETRKDRIIFPEKTA